MANFILLGGNGYLGRNFTRYGLQQSPNSRFYVVSRSGKNTLADPAITNIAAAVDSPTLLEKLPDQVDYVVDFIGAPTKDTEESKRLNDQPAQVMQIIAEEKGATAMGFVGGILGPRQFVQTKQAIIHRLQKSTVRLAYVEPTLVYGNGRKDSMTRMVPFLKFCGLFSAKMRPVNVNSVVKELWGKLVDNNAAE